MVGSGAGGVLQQNGHQGSMPVSLSQPHSVVGSLPPGWEQGVTPEGDVYYINHIDRTTSWFDPRIRKHYRCCYEAGSVTSKVYASLKAKPIICI